MKHEQQHERVLQIKKVLSIQSMVLTRSCNFYNFEHSSQYCLVLVDGQASFWEGSPIQWTSHCRTWNVMIQHHLENPHRCYHSKYPKLMPLDYTIYPIFVDMPGPSRTSYLRTAGTHRYQRLVSDNLPACETTQRYTETETVIHEMAHVTRMADLSFGEVRKSLIICDWWSMDIVQKYSETPLWSCQSGFPFTMFCSAGPVRTLKKPVC